MQRKEDILSLCTFITYFEVLFIKDLVKRANNKKYITYLSCLDALRKETYSRLDFKFKDSEKLSNEWVPSIIDTYTHTLYHNLFLH